MITVRDAWKEFPGEARPVLRGVDLEVAEGEFVVITGPSGSGKSTLLNLIAALDRLDRGDIVVDGRDLRGDHHLDEYRRNHVGIVFQLHNLLPRLTIAENLEVVMLGTGHGRHERHRRALEMLGRVGLADRAEEVPPRLSGGERQRVAIARAFANAPRLVLADEPTGSLDDDNTAIVLDLLRAQAAERGTIVAVSHDPRLTAAADRVVVLADGLITETPLHV